MLPVIAIYVPALMSETERFAHNGSLDSDDHWSQWVSRGRIGRRTRKSRRKNGQRSPLSRNSDFVIKNARYGVSDMRKYVKIVFTAFQKPQFAHLLTERPWFALPTET